MQHSHFTASMCTGTQKTLDYVSLLEQDGKTQKLHKDFQTQILHPGRKTNCWEW